ncbi:hypothetical protein PGT21_023223 [Puccinia graminis f. sp. tritici]|uniref:Uncharacterized protein n=1 Tax=Puccinia graminis f. sp. tritici TaxID=56615 RepID=A0A5B0PE34_PUCGR|nr:hypothetical protein PGT21_023223 [Puccinia graminis f. sp. tritici]
MGSFGSLLANLVGSKADRLHLITLGLHIDSTKLNLQFRQPTRFRINPQDSSIFSFQDQYSSFLNLLVSGSNLISHLTSRFRNASISLGAPYSVFFVGLTVDVGSIELAVGTQLDPLIFFVLRGLWSFVELTRRLNAQSSV